MTHSELQSLKELVDTLTLAPGYVGRQTFDTIVSAATLAGDDSLARQAKSRETNYYYMLRLISREGTSVPEGEMDIHRSFVANAVMMLKSHIREADAANPMSGQLRYQRRRPEETTETLVTDYLSELSRLRTDTGALTDSRERATIERIAADLFKRLWVCPIFDDDLQRLIISLVADDSIPAADRELWINAIGLGATEIEDISRIEILKDAYLTAPDRISVAAGMWLALLAIKGGDGAYVDAINFSIIHKDEFAVFFEYIIKAQANREAAAKGNDTSGLGKLMDIGRRMQQNISPDMRPEDLLGTDIDPETREALQHFAESESRGDDVYLSSLGQLRSFAFFGSIVGWFMPFNPDHSALAEIVDGEGAAIADSVRTMNMLCDSDKYAMMLSMAAIPASMRQTALSAVVDQLRAAADNEEFAMMMMQQPSRERLAALAAYNLTRFYLRYPQAFRFTDVLKQSLLPDAPCLVYFEPEQQWSERIGNEFYRRGLIDAAATIYSYLDVGATDNTDLLVRIADSFAHLTPEFPTAASWRQSVLDRLTELDADSLDAIFLLADHMDKRCDYEGIVELMQTHFDSFSTNTAYLLRLAQAMIDADMHTEAIDMLHRADYRLPQNDSRAKRLLAREETLLGNYDEAATYFDRADQAGDTVDDYDFRMWHAIYKWLTNQRQEALNTFACLSIVLDPLFRETFLSAIIELKPGLLSPDQIASLQLIPDMIEYKLYSPS